MEWTIQSASPLLQCMGPYAPAGTPATAALRLNAEVNRILATANARAHCSPGCVLASKSAAEFGAKAAEDSLRFGAIIWERKTMGD